MNKQRGRMLNQPKHTVGPEPDNCGLGIMNEEQLEHAEAERKRMIDAEVEEIDRNLDMMTIEILIHKEKLVVWNKESDEYDIVQSAQWNSKGEIILWFREK